MYTSDSSISRFQQLYRKRPLGGASFLLEHLDQNAIPSDDELLCAVYNALSDRTSNMLMILEKGSGKRNVRIGIGVRPMEKIKKSEGWNSRWSENMGVILGQLKVESNGLVTPFLQIEVSRPSSSARANGNTAD